MAKAATPDKRIPTEEDIKQVLSQAWRGSSRPLTVNEIAMEIARNLGADYWRFSTVVHVFALRRKLKEMHSRGELVCRRGREWKAAMRQTPFISADALYYATPERAKAWTSRSDEARLASQRNLAEQQAHEALALRYPEEFAALTRHFLVKRLEVLSEASPDEFEGVNQLFQAQEGNAPRTHG